MMAVEAATAQSSTSPQMVGCGVGGASNVTNGAVLCAVVQSGGGGAAPTMFRFEHVKGPMPEGTRLFTQVSVAYPYSCLLPKSCIYHLYYSFHGRNSI